MASAGPQLSYLVNRFCRRHRRENRASKRGDDAWTEFCGFCPGCSFVILSLSTRCCLEMFNHCNFQFENLAFPGSMVYV
ncbi:hypothetical protein OIU76_019962 [Salix suchowensis]|nr:hypothetical protein OIU76_019962 [Salix suchowensis]